VAIFGMEFQFLFLGGFAAPPPRALSLLLEFQMGDSQQALYLRGTLTGHNGWITAIATGEPGAQDTVLTASRGKFVFSLLLCVV
jgi:hypothetical protein